MRWCPLLCLLVIAVQALLFAFLLMSTSSGSRASPPLKLASVRGHPAWIVSYATRHGTPRTKDTKYIVYRCRRGDLCGGIGDRLRGIMATFYLAIATGRAMMIDMDAPIPFDTVMHPTTFDWRYRADIIEPISKVSIDSMDHLNPSILQLLSPEFDQWYAWPMGNAIRSG